MNIVKTLKEVENTVLSEIKKQDPNLANGFIQNENNALKKEYREQSTNTEAQYKVNLSVDSLSSDSLKNIFKSMRRTLTRRVSERIPSTIYHFASSEKSTEIDTRRVRSIFWGIGWVS